MIAHLALEGVLALVAATEALTDVVVLPAEPGMPSPKRELGLGLVASRPLSREHPGQLGGRKGQATPGREGCDVLERGL